MNNQPAEITDLIAFRDNDFPVHIEMEDGIPVENPVVVAIAIDEEIRTDIYILTASTPTTIDFTLTKAQLALIPAGRQKVTVYVKFAGKTVFTMPLKVTMDGSKPGPRSKTVSFPAVGTIRASVYSEIGAIVKSEEAAKRSEEAAKRAEAFGSGTGTAEPSTVPAAGINIVRVSQAGTYVNFGGLVVTSDNLIAGLVELRKVGGAWTKVITPVNTTLGARVDKNENDLRAQEVFIPMPASRTGENAGLGVANGAASTISFPAGQAPFTTSLQEQIALADYPELTVGVKIRLCYFLTETPAGLFDTFYPSSTTRWCWPSPQLNVIRNGVLGGDQGVLIEGYERLSANVVRCYVDYTIQTGDTVFIPYLRLTSDVNQLGVTVTVKWEPTQYTFVKTGSSINNTSELIKRLTEQVRFIPMISQALDDIYEKSRTEIWVPNNSKIADAVHAIDDSGPKKRYVVKFSGYHLETEEIKIYAHPWVDLVGVGRSAHIHFEQPDNASLSAIELNSAIFSGRDNRLFNFRVTAKNARYAIHHDNGNAYQDSNNLYQDLVIEHLGNDGAVAYRLANSLPAGVWANQDAFGSGGSSGEFTQVVRCVLKSKNANPAGIHNLGDFEKPMHFRFKNSALYCENFTGSGLKIDAYGSGTADIVELISCDIPQATVYYSQAWFTLNPLFQQSDAREIKLSFVNMIAPGTADFTRGQALKIALNAAGVNHIRISGTAADLFGGFVYRDGAAGMQAYCFSRYDVFGLTAANTIGQRVGDCSTTPKTLVISRKTGSTITVTFNQDYRTKTNAEMIDIINGSLGAAGVASIYRPARWEDFQDQGENQCYVRNDTSVSIPPRKGVMYTNATCSKVQLSDIGLDLQFAGVTAEWIRPGEVGRILTRTKFIQRAGDNDLTIEGALSEGIAISLSATTAGDFETGEGRKVGYCNDYGESVFIYADQ
jgi:hypothetical protein